MSKGKKRHGCRWLKNSIILCFSIALSVTMLFNAKALASDATSPQKDGSAEKTLLRFKDVRASSGITFQHYGERYRWCDIGPDIKGIATNEKISVMEFQNPLEFAEKHLIRMNGSGAAWLDYDSDGDWDLYLVNGAGGPSVTNALYRNNGDGTFTDVTTQSGAGDPGEGMAVSVADYDNDGFTDLFVTNFGDFALYKNNGNGTFTNTTDTAFANGPKFIWYGGSAWGDIDNDGDLDLYVAGYVDWNRRHRDTALRFPMDFDGFPNVLYRNNGDGTFTDVTDKAHVGDGYRKTMQVLFADLNSDGWVDIFVGNDTDPNSMYLNRGDGTFKEFSGPSGTSSTDGTMGIAYGDYNNDGKMDLFLSNYTGEADILYTLVDNESTNDGKVRNAIYRGDFYSTAMLMHTWDKVGWGTGFYDFDNDGDLDLFVANGHLNAISGDNRDENQLFENDGRGRFADVSASSGVLDSGKRIYRGAAFADFDGDGKVDIYVVNNGEKSYDASADRTGILLKNMSPDHNNWIKLRFQGTKSNRDGYGVKVKLTCGNKTQVSELISTSSYFSANAKELHIGLGQHKTIDKMEVWWPSGIKQTMTHLVPNQTILVVEGDKLP